MPAQIIQMMAFAQIMDIWRPGRSMEDHLNPCCQQGSEYGQSGPLSHSDFCGLSFSPYATCGWMDRADCSPSDMRSGWYSCLVSLFKKKDYNRLCPSACSIQMVNFTSSNYEGPRSPTKILIKIRTSSLDSAILIFTFCSEPLGPP